MNNEEQNLDGHYVRTLEHRLRQIAEQQYDDAELLDWLESRTGKYHRWALEYGNGMAHLFPANSDWDSLIEPVDDEDTAWGDTVREVIRKAMEMANQ